MRQTVLITGASGFVGEHLCNELEKHGYMLRPVYRRDIPVERKNCGVVVQDVYSKTDWSKALARVDVVVHLAARVHVMKADDSAALQAFLEVNLQGTERLARQAATAGVKRFIYLSSIKVNGEYTDTHAFNNGSVPAPQGAYAVSKYCAEQALLQIAKETGMEVVILRPSLIYGPKVKANFYNLLRLVNSGWPLPLANIRNRRSLLYVGNLVHAIMLCVSHPNATGKTFLVSDGEAISTSKLIQKLAKALGRRCILFPLPLKLCARVMRIIGKASALDRLTQSLMIDDSHIRNQLTWSPPYTLDQGLQETADWYLREGKS